MTSLRVICGLAPPHPMKNPGYAYAGHYRFSQPLTRTRLTVHLLMRFEENAFLFDHRYLSKQKYTNL